MHCLKPTSRVLHGRSTAGAVFNHFQGPNLRIDIMPYRVSAPTPAVYSTGGSRIAAVILLFVPRWRVRAVVGMLVVFLAPHACTIGRSDRLDPVLMPVPYAHLSVQFTLVTWARRDMRALPAAASPSWKVRVA